jgi:hypothetical protein
MKTSRPSAVFVFSLIFLLISACGVLPPSTPDTSAPDDYYLTSRPENRVSGKIFELQAGQSIRFFANLGEDLTPEHQQIEVAAWSIDLAEGAAIDGEGLLSAGEDLPHGTVVTVSAHTAAGIIQTQVLVYSREVNPLVGNWKEIEPANCGSATPIDELLFLADGRFFLTWRAFEWYVDYEGLYRFDLDSGSLELFQIEEVNDLPPDLEDSAGAFFIDHDGRLVIEELFFGSPPGETLIPGQCTSYQFERR